MHSAGGFTRGAAAPLVGGAARLWRRGGNPPAPAFPPEGETGKGEIRFLAAAGSSPAPDTQSAFPAPVRALRKSRSSHSKAGIPHSGIAVFGDPLMVPGAALSAPIHGIRFDPIFSFAF